MVAFCKTSTCPSSPELLAFESGRFTSGECGKIKTHLADCEFCSSEVEFYAHYPPAEETIARVAIPIPIPLYELAEALLGDKHKDFFTLNKLLCESEGVKI